MENFNAVAEMLKSMGVENPSKNEVSKIAQLVLEGYQVEIFRQELSKVKQMRNQCAEVVKNCIQDNHPFGGGRDQMIEVLTDAIIRDSELPNLTNTVRYMVAADF